MLLICFVQVHFDIHLLGGIFIAIFLLCIVKTGGGGGGGGVGRVCVYVSKKLP